MRKMILHRRLLLYVPTSRPTNIYISSFLHATDFLARTDERATSTKTGVKMGQMAATKLARLD